MLARAARIRIGRHVLHDKRLWAVLFPASFCLDGLGSLGVETAQGSAQWHTLVIVPRMMRRVFLPLVAVLLVVCVAASVLGLGLTRRSFPEVDGEVVVTGLSGNVEVIRDELGVSHIYADTSEDLFRGQGYVAAQDRFFQMDLRRHIASGRLSELVGSGGIEADRAVRTMGWRIVAEEELALLDPTARRYLQSYTDGVNAYLEANSSPSQMSLEYVALAQSAPGYQVESWDEVDSLVWLKAMAWDLRGNYTDELLRARLAGDLSAGQLDSLYPDYPYDLNAPILSANEWSPPQTSNGGAAGRGGTVADATPQGDAGVEIAEPPTSPLTQQQLADGGDAFDGTLAALEAIPPMAANGEGVGSNSWVVSGDHTDSGMPLLANDPHLGISQPGIWLQTGLHCREINEDCTFDVTGFSLAGVPGVVIGHNQEIAWGFTNLDPDVTDFYLEDIQGTEYLVDGEWEEVESRVETIKVAGGADEDILVRSTKHGPVMSDVVNTITMAGQSPPIQGVESSGRYEVALSWTGLEPGRTAEAIFGMNSATNFEEFQAGAALFDAPSQNLLYADVEGNIGYQAPGLVPVRESATAGAPPGYLPAPGWNSAYDWKGWVPFEQMPTAYNPEDGVIVAANQAVSQGSNPYLTTEWDSGYRAQRIADLLATHMEAGPLTSQTMSEIQYDSYNSFADTLVPYLMDVDLGGSEFYTEPRELLGTWDRTAPVGDGVQGSGAMYFYAVWAQLLNLTVDDEMPLDAYATGNSRSMLMISNLLESPDDKWWDDTRTPGVVESRDQILEQALVQARLQLTQDISKDTGDWQWGRLHEVTLAHEVLGDPSVPGIVQSIFNGGTYATPGGSALVNANNWDAGTGEFAVTSGPSMRMVVDLADLDASTWVNQTGNSGHVFNDNYDDQTQAWIDGETYPWAYSRDSVEASQENVLTLIP